MFLKEAGDSFREWFYLIVCLWKADQMNGNKRNVRLSLFKMKWLNPFPAQLLISLTSLMVFDELSNFLSCIKQYRWLHPPTACLCKLTLNMKFMTSVLICVLKSVFYVEECKELSGTSFKFMKKPLDHCQLQSFMPQSAGSHHGFGTELLGSKNNWLPRLVEWFPLCFCSRNIAC